MKKVFAILAIAGFVACNNAENATTATDTTAKVDSPVTATVDTTKTDTTAPVVADTTVKAAH